MALRPIRRSPPRYDTVFSCHSQCARASVSGNDPEAPASLPTLSPRPQSDVSLFLRGVTENSPPRVARAIDWILRLPREIPPLPFVIGGWSPKKTEGVAVWFLTSEAITKGIESAPATTPRPDLWAVLTHPA